MQELGAYRAVNTIHLGYIKPSLLMLYKAKVVVCFEIHTQHIDVI
jgi:hypothetical protein